jgi:hypothetical protein
MHVWMSHTATDPSSAHDAMCRASSAHTARVTGPLCPSRSFATSVKGLFVGEGEGWVSARGGRTRAAGVAASQQVVG